MYCSKCGRLLPEEANFCMICGQRVWGKNYEEMTNYIKNEENNMSYVQSNNMGYDWNNNAVMGNNVVTGNNAVMGNNGVIGNNAVTENNVTMGNNAAAGNNAIMGNNTVVGNYAVTGNPLVGKKYSFYSAYGMRVFGLLTRIYCEVGIDRDRLYMQKNPKKYNDTPVVVFSDITSIDISMTMSPVGIFDTVTIGIILVFLLCTSSIYTLYFIGILVLTVIFGLQYKITIFQRNGVNAVIYEKHMKDAEEFVKDIKLLTGV